MATMSCPVRYLSSSPLIDIPDRPAVFPQPDPPVAAAGRKANTAL